MVGQPLFPSTMDPRVEEGIEILQNIWYSVAIKIINLAIEVYNLDDSQAAALKEIYLRPNDYIVQIRND